MLRAEILENVEWQEMFPLVPTRSSRLGQCCNNAGIGDDTIVKQRILNDRISTRVCCFVQTQRCAECGCLLDPVPTVLGIHDNVDEKECSPVLCV